MAPQATVILDAAPKVGNVAAKTVMVLTLGVIALPHWSLPVQVSVTTPPQGPGAVVWVEVIHPLIRQLPARSFV